VIDTTRYQCLILKEVLHAMATLQLLVTLLPIFAILSAQAQTFTTLYAFTGGSDGGFPWAGLVRDSAGNLYGTTLDGGNIQSCYEIGCGTVFKLDKNGKETVLHSFSGPPKDGASPWAPLVQDRSGAFYGTTASGGRYDNGTVFKLSGSDREKLLYSFPNGLVNGDYPTAGLVRDGAGNLYGVTGGGGLFGAGTIFEVTASGHEKLLYTFTGGLEDGAGPSGLIRDSQAVLYGTTCGGGAYGDGTVFKLDTTGSDSLLYSFTGGPDGRCPTAGLVRDRSGNFYGTTSNGNGTGCGGYGCGTVFMLNTSGKETTLYSFAGGSDGGNPGRGSLVLDPAGNLYGTTTGGTYYGVIFELTPNSGGGWTETVLYTFDGQDGGGASGLIRDAAGNLYGTTSEFGPNDAGTVFKLAP
jgi:uncharacterized repeat protein (TIGR03803 family)